MYLTIRFAGYGGYGIVTASRILGLAFLQEGYHVLQTESHGAAARGETSTADLTISSNSIYELNFDCPDILVALSAKAYHKCREDSPTISNELLFIEELLLRSPDIQRSLRQIQQQTTLQIYELRLKEIVEELGHMRYMGMASLGALAKVDARIPLARLKTTIRSDTKLRRFSTQNLESLLKGMNLVIRHTPNEL